MLQYALPPPVVMGSAPKVPVVKVVALKVPVAKVVTFKVPEKSTEVEIQEDEFDMVDYGMQGKVKRVRRTERFVVSRVWTKRGGYSHPGSSISAVSTPITPFWVSNTHATQHQSINKGCQNNIKNHINSTVKTHQHFRPDKGPYTTIFLSLSPLLLSK